MKRILSFLLSVIIVIGIITSVPVTVSAASTGICGDNLTWTLDDEGVFTISGTGDMKNYSSSSDTPWYRVRGDIDSIIINSGVRSVGDCVFEDCTNLTSVTIPDSVTSIGYCAFWNCSNLISITIPDSVKVIGIDAFDNTGYYNDESNWQSNVLYIGNHLIEAKKPLSEAYTIKEGTKTIAACAFYGCTSLNSISIPDSVTSIGNQAFDGCTSLCSITIPDSVTSIGYYAFKGCTNLSSITIPDSVKSIGDSAFEDCTGLTSIIIPDSVTSIEYDTFYGCENLVSITIPDSVTSIGDYAFGNCSNLTYITIPDSVITIGQGAFYCCESLTTIRIPDSVKSIGDSAFEDCTGLTSIIIPDSVTSIGYDAFNNTEYYNDESNWQSNVLYIGNHLIEAKKPLSEAYTIKEGTKTIAPSAFYGCTSLNSISISDSVTSIGGSAFEDCTGLTSIIIPDSVTSIGCDAFNNTEYYNDSSNWENDVLYIGNYIIKANESLFVSYEIKEGTKVIADYAFSNCSNLYTITIPDSVTSIGCRAFYECGYLTSITIPDSVVSIGNGAFYECESLTAIRIPDGVTSIGDDTFGYCESLTTITIPDSVISIGYDAFYSCDNFKYVFYEGNFAQWSEISIDSGNSHLSNAVIHFESADHIASDWIIDKEVTCTDSGSKHKECTVCSCVIETIEITETGHTMVGGVCSACGMSVLSFELNEDGKSYSVTECDTSAEGEIIIPAKYNGLPVTNIGDSAFCDCYNLTEVVIGGNVKSIGNEAFFGCSLTSIEIPDSVTSIGYWAFRFCTSLTSVTIPDSVSCIGASAFYQCRNLTSITVAENNPCYSSVNGILFNKDKTEIIEYPASKTIKEYIIPDGVTIVNNYAFEGCKSLTSITIPESVTTIGAYAFYDCTGLKSVSIPDTVISIGESALGYYATWKGPFADEDFIIYGKKSTVAETYAKENGFTFIGNCEHKTTKWITEKEATVNTPGKKHKECTECGEVLEAATIKQLKCSKPKLKKIENTTSGVKITWNKVTGADNYEIYRKTGKKAWKKIATVKGTVTTYTDKNVKSGTTYKYTVKAKNEAGLSGYNTTGLTIKCLADPVLKTLTSAEKGITLKWSKVTGAQGYVVYRKTGSGSYSKLATVKGVSKVSYLDKSAKKNKKYTYKVKAYYGKTYSAYSNTKTIKDKY